MDDRELLELAAKAAGIVGTWARWHEAYGDHWIEGLDCGGPIVWNPLADDGDALRLAVKLLICIDHVQFAVFAGNDNGNDLASESVASAIPRDKATRRAIVRAAAELGKAMSNG